MITNIKDFIKMINESKVYDMEDGLYGLFEENKLYDSDFKFTFIETTSYMDRHRWYEVNKDIYEVELGGKSYYVGIYYVGQLFSECMSLSDTDEPVRAVQCEKVLSYRFEDME